MPGEDKPPQQQTRQRKKNKKSRSKGKSPGGSPNAPLGGAIDDQDDLFLSPALQPPLKKTAEGKPKVAVAKVEEESSVAICLQVLFPYLLAGMGMVMAGMVLDDVQVRAQPRYGLMGTACFVDVWYLNMLIVKLLLGFQPDGLLISFY